MKFLKILIFIAFFSFGFNYNSGLKVSEPDKTPKDSYSASDIKDEAKSGIIYFSTDNGNSWIDKSNGFPNGVFMTDIAVSDDLLGIATKNAGVFLYNFQKSKWEKIETKPDIDFNIDALFFFNNKIFAGTQNGGIYVSSDMGKTWNSLNKGLGNLTIRKLGAFHNKLYACTNGGLFSLNEKEDTWYLEYGSNGLQVNGITEFANEIYIGTNQGAFKSSDLSNNWKKLKINGALHNISSDENTLYAMVYNELFKSADKGNTWQSIQKGLPDKLYTFQVMKNDDVIFAGQWNGIYRMKNSGSPLYINGDWEFSSNGLPPEFAVTEMKIFKNMIIIGCSERGFKNGSKSID